MHYCIFNSWILSFSEEQEFLDIHIQENLSLFLSNKCVPSLRKTKYPYLFSPSTLLSWKISLFFKFSNFTNIKVLRLKSFESAWMDKELRFLFPLHNITQEWSFFSNLLKCARDNNPQKNRKQIIITKKERQSYILFRNTICNTISISFNIVDFF